MNSRSTWVWIGVAGALFAAIFALEKFGPKPPPGPGMVLPGFKASAVTSIEISPAGHEEIRAERTVNGTNSVWQLTRPVAYPAQPEAVEALLAALEKLPVSRAINAAEIGNRSGADEEFGFAKPRATITIQHGEHRQLRVGALTAPGDQVYLEVVGVGVFIVDAEWIKLLPKSANDWRELWLVNANSIVSFNRIVISNATGVIGVDYDATNRLWTLARSDRPRADEQRLAAMLQGLLNARVTQFVTDNTNADLEAFGLQPPALEIVFANETNVCATLQFGKAAGTNAALCYARRAGLSAVVTAPVEPLALWQSTFAEFRDHRLLPLAREVGEIEITGAEAFKLVRVSSNEWRVAGRTIAPDAKLTGEILTNIAAMKIVTFKDTVTAPDLQELGLDKPVLEILLRGSVTNGAVVTNAVFAHLSFGTNSGEHIWVRRSDENSVYAVPLVDFRKLPVALWQLRERRIWNFSGSDVAKITARYGGQVAVASHMATNSWSFSPGALSPPNDFAIEEIAHRLGSLEASIWTERATTNLAAYNIVSGQRYMNVELKDGRSFGVSIGDRSPAGYPYAATELDGETWVFEFPISLFELLMFYVVSPFNPT